MVDRQLDSLAVTDVHHPLTVAPRRRHRLLTVNGVDGRRTRTVDDEVGVYCRRYTDADDVGLHFRKHGLVVLIDGVETVVFGERFGVLPNDVHTSNERTRIETVVSAGVTVCHRVSVPIPIVRVGAGSDHGDTICHYQ